MGEDKEEAVALPRTMGVLSTAFVIGSIAAWMCAVMAVIGFFVVWMVGKAVWGVIKVLPIALLAVGRSVEEAIGESNHDSNGKGGSAFDSVWGGRRTRRSA